MATELNTLAPTSAAAAGQAAQAITPAAFELERSVVDTWMRYFQASTAAFFHVQQTSLELGLRLLDAAYSTKRRSLETWLLTTQQTQQQVQQVLSSWASEADTALASAQRASQRTANPIKRDAERAASQAEAALEQERARERHEVDRGRAAQSQERTGSPTEPSPISVVKREDDWAVMREDAQRPSRVFDTKREAVERARELARHDGAEVRIENGASGAP